MNRKRDNETQKINTRLKECGAKRTREGANSGVGRREWTKHGKGTKDRDTRSWGIEIHMVDVFVMTKPTSPFRLVKHVV